MLSNGTFLSGMITLKSSIVFHIDTTATLRGTQDDTDYPATNPPTANTQLSNCRKTLVYAQSAHDIRIEGGGTLDGNGNTPKWLGPHTVHPEYTRPMVLYTALSTNVTVTNVHFKDAAMWCLVSLEDDNLLIDNVTINSTLSGNRDGIDVVDCHHVTIQNTTISSEDDSICFKSGIRRGVDDVTVKDSHVAGSLVANGLKFGTASYGAFTNVTFQNIVVEHADKAAMAVEAVDGADIAHITFQNIQFHDVGSPIFIILGDRGNTPSNDVHKVGTIDSITFKDITGDTMRYHWSSPISGSTLPDNTTHKLTNLVFDNVNITNKGGMTSVPGDPPEYKGQYPDPNLWGDMPAFGYFIRHADNVTFTHSTTTVSPGDARQWLQARDFTNLVVN
jgi:polygalacturonase